MSTTDSRLDDLLDEMLERHEAARAAMDVHAANIADRDALARQARQAGVSAIKIAQILGVSRGMVYKILDNYPSAIEHHHRKD